MRIRPCRQFRIRAWALAPVRRTGCAMTVPRRLKPQPLCRLERHGRKLCPLKPVPLLPADPPGCVCPGTGARLRGGRRQRDCIVMHFHVYLFIPGRAAVAPGFAAGLHPAGRRIEKSLKELRHNAIRDLLARSAVANQDDLRRKLRRRGFAVTQATLSRDIHELRLLKGPQGYSLPNGPASAPPPQPNGQPAVEEMLDNFGISAEQAMNQVVVRTMIGGAQPVAAALDRARWPDVVGTVAGDDTVLVICPDQKRAADVEARLRTMLES